jgi:hypothetical protein
MAMLAQFKAPQLATTNNIKPGQRNQTTAICCQQNTPLRWSSFTTQRTRERGLHAVNEG